MEAREKEMSVPDSGFDRIGKVADRRQELFVREYWRLAMELISSNAFFSECQPIW